MSPDSRDVSLRYVGNSSSHREEIPNRRVWSQVLLPDVGLLNMLQEGFLVVEVTSSSGSGGPHGSNCVVNGELVVHEDGLWLVAPRSPGVYLLEQVAVEGRRFSRKESIEEGEVPAVREEAMDCEELMEEIRCGFEGTVDYPMLRVHHMICVLRSPPKERSTSPFVPSRVPEHHSDRCRQKRLLSDSDICPKSLIQLSDRCRFRTDVAQSCFRRRTFLYGPSDFGVRSVNYTIFFKLSR